MLIEEQHRKICHINQYLKVIQRGEFFFRTNSFNLNHKIHFIDLCMYYMNLRISFALYVLIIIAEGMSHSIFSIY